MGIRIDIVNGAGTALRMNDGTADANGHKWWVHDIQGWGAKTPLINTVKRMASDGLVVTNATYASRRITMSGVVETTAATELFEPMQVFETACDSVTADGKVRVYEPAGTRHALVRLNGQPRIQPDRRAPTLLRWTVQFICPNPDLQAGA